MRSRLQRPNTRAVVGAFHGRAIKWPPLSLPMATLGLFDTRSAVTTANWRTCRSAKISDHPSRAGSADDQDVSWLEITMRKAAAVHVQHSIQQSTEKPGQNQRVFIHTPPFNTTSCSCKIQFVHLTAVFSHYLRNLSRSHWQMTTRAPRADVQTASLVCPYLIISALDTPSWTPKSCMKSHRSE